MRNVNQNNNNRLAELVGLAFKGLFQAKLYDAQGNLLNGNLLAPNGVTNVGKNLALDVMFNGASAVTTWYMGLINNSGYSALSGSDTMSSHAGWTEWTSYAEATRPVWDPDAASGQAVVNSTLTSFTMNATGNIQGVFLTSNNTKGGTTGTLWATALFTSPPVAVISTNVLKHTYTVNAT